MKKQDYDERQLYVRGIAYKFTTLIFTLELYAWAVLRELGILDAEPMGEFLILIAPPFTILMAVCILKDAYDPINGRPGLILFSIMPISGLAMLFVKAKEHAVLVRGNCITADGGIVLIYIVWLAVSAIYWAKYIKERRQE